MDRISFDDQTGSVVFKAQKWAKSGKSYKPIYLIRCACGKPLVAHFKGVFPEHDDNVKDLEGYGSGEIYRVIKTKRSWAIYFKQTDCTCGKKVFMGESIIKAAGCFLSEIIFEYRYGNDDIRLPNDFVIDRIGLIKKACEKSDYIHIMKEEITGREDYLIVLSKYWDDWQHGKETYEEYEERKKKIRKEICRALNIPIGDKFKQAMLDQVKEEKDKKEIDVNSLAHDEECTCSLCVK